MKNRELIEGTISDIAFGGDGILKTDAGVVFVPFVALGERVRVELTQKKKNFARGRLLEVLTPSAGRVTPPCPHFQICGGCQYQHISYEQERTMKMEQLKQLLKRIGGVEGVEIRPIISGPEYAYRNRITIHQENGLVGFRSLEGNRLVDIEECALATAEVNRKLRHLRSKSHPRPHYSIRADAVMGEAFYQTNAPLMDTLQKTVCDAVSAEAAAILELYCGVGFFTSVLAKRGVPITAVESDPKALEIARRAMPANVKLMEGTAEELCGLAISEMKKSPWTLLVDPPREGLSEIVRQDVLNSGADEMVYLSCDPATLARDLKAIASAFQPVWFQPIDLFPRTAHIECLTLLRKK